MKQYEIIKFGGATVILCKFPTKSLYFDFAFKVGSRYENKKNNGLSHFVEHLYCNKIFDSIKSHPWIRHYIDDTFHAYTTRERTNFEFIIHEKDAELGIRLIPEIVQGLKLNKEIIEREKGIILEEFLEDKENIDFSYYKSVQDLYFGDSSLGFEILGTEENIKKFTVSDINKFIKKYYTLDNMILTISGNFNIKKLKRTINKELKPLLKSQKRTKEKEIKFKDFCYSGDSIHIKDNDKINKTFFGYYYPFFNTDVTKNVEWEFFIDILNNYLFYKITDKLSIYSLDINLATYREFSNFRIESSFHYKKTEDFYTLLLKELKLFRKAFSKKDLNYFKEGNMINLDLSKDSRGVATNVISWHALTFGTDNILTIADQQRIIKSINLQKIQYYFDLLFKDKKGTVIISGKISEARKQKLKKIWDKWEI